MNIPHVIHQTWRTADVPPEWAALTESWRTRHPGWEMRLWTDADNQRLVDEHYPDLAGQYASCPYGIQRADIARYLIVHRWGGVYVDLDIECLRPLDSLIAGRSCMLTIEPGVHAAWIGRRQLVSNAFLAATPRHPFMERVLDLLRVRDLRISRHSDVLTSTGPVLMGEALSNGGFADVTFLPPETFSPLASNDPDLARLRDGHGATAIRAKCLAAGAWGIHYWANTWVRGLAGPLVNPDPHHVPGYVFHPGVDSPGFDLFNVGRDVARLAERCDAELAAVGFNTDGFLKSFIRARADWTTLQCGGPGEGLYVKRAFHFGEGGGEDLTVRETAEQAPRTSSLPAARSARSADRHESS